MSNEKETVTETELEQITATEAEDSTTVLDGDVYRDMVVSAANALENEDSISKGTTLIIPK